MDNFSTREVLKDELESTRRQFHQLLERIPARLYLKPTSNPAWNVAEVLYHMSIAPRYISSDVVFIRRFSWIPKPPGQLFHMLNNWMTKRGAKHATHQYLADQYDKAHDRMMKTFFTIRDDEWTKGAEYPGWDPMLDGFVTLERLFHYPTQHFQVHAEELSDLVDQDSASDNFSL